MNKHTPGPWVVRESPLGVSVVCPNGEVVFHESDKRIPGVMSDAHLIAAAPDLLEALTSLERTSGIAAPHDDPARVAARAATAKAKGGGE